MFSTLYISSFFSSLSTLDNSNVVGVYPQLVSGAGPYLKPDMWTLLEELGTKRICDYYPYLFPLLNEAQSRGQKLSIALAPTPNLPSLNSVWQSTSSMISHLQTFNLAQYRNHPAIAGWVLTDEPLVSTSFDAGNPSQEVLNVVAVGNAGLDYIKQQDPTHPVTINLNGAGAWGDAYLQFRQYPDSYQSNLAKTENWQRLWAGHCDIIMRTFELCGSGSYGQTWAAYPSETLQIYTDYYVMMRAVANGKPVRFAVGCKSSVDSESVPFTEEIQRDYYVFLKSFLSDKPDLSIDIFQLADFYSDSRYDWGVFHNDVVNGMNKPKLSVSAIKDLTLNLPLPPPSPDAETCKVTVISPSSGGTINPALGFTVEKGTTVTFSATPYSGYEFDGFTVNGEIFKTSTIQLIVVSDVTVTCSFVPSTTGDPPIIPSPTQPQPLNGSTNTILITAVGVTAVSVTLVWTWRKRRKI